MFSLRRGDGAGCPLHNDKLLGQTPGTNSWDDLGTAPSAASMSNLHQRRSGGGALARSSVLVALAGWSAIALAGDPVEELRAAWSAGSETIVEAELTEHLRQLASPELEGRDSPSQGLARAGRYIARAFHDAGLAPVAGAAPTGEAPKTESEQERNARELAAYLRPFENSLPRPLPSGCSLSLTVTGQPPREFELGREFVPLVHASGTASGELCFAGYGIESSEEHFDELGGKNLSGKVVLIVEGEPRHAKRFEGPEISADALLWTKLEHLREAKAAGALIARRPPGASLAKKPVKAGDGPPLDPPELSFRATWARWNDARGRGERGPAEGAKELPALEVSLACASALLGEDVLALADRIDKTVHPLRKDPKGRSVALRSATERAQVPIPNVVGVIAGSDASLAKEYVVVGAHYDHIGVDERGRIGCGADDNASGSSALIELAQALAVAKPRRSILVCAFAAEEDGLLGSAALCRDPPVPREQMVAMINLDMLGVGEKDAVAVLGLVQNPTLEKLIARANRYSRTGVRDITMRQGEELFERSDHFSFHKLGVPVLFFFEGLPIEKNPDYHTWRDTLDKLDPAKILNTTRLVYNCLWCLANDDARPPAPGG
jgi:peptidase M28-like protein